MTTDRRRPTAPRDRQLLAQHQRTQHMLGWSECGQGRTLPADASPDFVRGYRECMVDSSARGAV